jgi:uncharacterized membrane-anchored protein
LLKPSLSLRWLAAVAGGEKPVAVQAPAVVVLAVLLLLVVTVAGMFLPAGASDMKIKPVTHEVG